jgi:hypothetical protein
VFCLIGWVLPFPKDRFTNFALSDFNPHSTSQSTVMTDSHDQHRIDIDM